MNNTFDFKVNNTFDFKVNKIIKVTGDNFITVVLEATDKSFWPV